MLFRQGHIYVGAADLPWYVSLGMARGSLQDEGFTDVRVYDTDDPRAPDVKPPNRRGFNALAVLTWPHADTELELPGEVAWIVDVTPVVELEPAPMPRPPTMEEEIAARTRTPGWVIQPGIPAEEPGPRWQLLFAAVAGTAVLAGLIVLSSLYLRHAEVV